MSERFISRWARLKRSREQAAGPVEERKAPSGQGDRAATPGPDGPDAAGRNGLHAAGPGMVDSGTDNHKGGSPEAAVARAGESAADAAVADPNEDLPPIASLTPDSDFTPFLRRGVAPDARNAALKKLFTDPHYNVMDGLDVYIDDYNVTEPIPEKVLARLLSEHGSGLLEAALDSLAGGTGAVDGAGHGAGAGAVDSAGAGGAASARIAVDAGDKAGAGAGDKAGAGAGNGAGAGAGDGEGAWDPASTGESLGPAERMSGPSAASRLKAGAAENPGGATPEADDSHGAGDPEHA